MLHMLLPLPTSNIMVAGTASTATANGRPHHAGTAQLKIGPGKSKKLMMRVPSMDFTARINVAAAPAKKSSNSGGAMVEAGDGVGH